MIESAKILYGCLIGSVFSSMWDLHPLKHTPLLGFNPDWNHSKNTLAGTGLIHFSYEYSYEFFSERICHTKISMKCQFDSFSESDSQCYPEKLMFPVCVLQLFPLVLSSHTYRKHVRVSILQRQTVVSTHWASFEIHLEQIFIEMPMSIQQLYQVIVHLSCTLITKGLTCGIDLSIGVTELVFPMTILKPNHRYLSIPYISWTSNELQCHVQL